MKCTVPYLGLIPANILLSSSLKGGEGYAFKIILNNTFNRLLYVPSNALKFHSSDCAHMHACTKPTPMQGL